MSRFMLLFVLCCRHSGALERDVSTKDYDGASLNPSDGHVGMPNRPRRYDSAQSNNETKASPSFFELHRGRQLVSPRSAGVAAAAAAAASDSSFTGTPPLFWLHIPKCGTSFGTSVVSYPTHLTRDLTLQHQSLSVVRDESQLRAAVGLFRSPDQRLLSAFYWIKKDKTCCTIDWGWSPAVYGPVRGQIRQGAPEATIAPFKGCQTNMVLGKGCMARGPGAPPHTQVEVARAKARLQLFRFVGLQEEWRTSICLFNFVMTGRRFVEPRQLGKIQPGLLLDELASTVDRTNSAAARAQEAANAALAAASVYPPSFLGPLHFDAADTALYESAKARFRRECFQFGINASTCPLERA